MLSKEVMNFQIQMLGTFFIKLQIITCSYFAHGENIHIGMLADDDEVFRRKAVIKVLHLKGLIEDLQSEDGDFVGGTVESDGNDTDASESGLNE